MASVYFSTPITNPRNVINDAEPAFHGDLPISNASAMPGNFEGEASTHLVNLNLTENGDMPDYSFITPIKCQKIQEEPKIEPSHIHKASQIPRKDQQKKLNNQGVATKGKLHASSKAICQNKYSCENCQQSFKNRILLQRHVCPNAIKGQCGLFNKTMNNIVHKMKEKYPEEFTKSTFNSPKSTVNTKFNDKVLIDKTREGMYTPRKSLMRMTSDKTPATQVEKSLTGKNCDNKFSSCIPSSLHMRQTCVAPLKKGSMTEGYISGLNKTIVSDSVTVQDLINTEVVKKNGFSLDADIAKTKQKIPVVKKYKDFGGIPVCSKLNLALQNLKMQLQPATAPVENTTADKNKI